MDLLIGTLSRFFWRATGTGCLSFCPSAIVLLCHKLALWQQGHRNKRLAMARASLMRMVAIDVLTWRSARIGGSSGSITRG